MTVWTRSAIIGRFESLILQGNVDPLWSSTEKDFYFHEAVDLVHSALVEADLDLFVTRGAVIASNGDGSYDLPADCYAVKWVEDSEGVYRPVDHYSEKEIEQIGYSLVDETLILVNVSESDWPATLTIDYIREPKEIPEWDGTPDPETIEDDADFLDYQPDYPMNTARGARCLARVIQILAKTKDDSVSEAESKHVNNVIGRFVDRLISRKQFE